MKTTQITPFQDFKKTMINMSKKIVEVMDNSTKELGKIK